MFSFDQSAVKKRAVRTVLFANSDEDAPGPIFSDAYKISHRKCPISHCVAVAFSDYIVISDYSQK